MNKLVFQGIVDICSVHADRLCWSMQQLSEKEPFTAESMSQLTDIELAIFDQFIIRFSKLQDVMGAKLLLAHDYPEDPEIQASLLNKAFGMAKYLLSLLDNVVRFSFKYR